MISCHYVIMWSAANAPGELPASLPGNSCQVPCPVMFLGTQPWPLAGRGARPEPQGAVGEENAQRTACAKSKIGLVLRERKMGRRQTPDLEQFFLH